jgi:diadenosine tetraphosphate (Ap4A) HIT family hydrolase
VRVWEDGLWRLSALTHGQVPGFSFLEPKRHVRYVEELDGEEAATFGSVLARSSAALKEAAGAERVFVYVFGGGIPHLHLHLAPHTEGDALSATILRGEVETKPGPGGTTLLLATDFPVPPRSTMREVAARARELLA